MKLPNIFESSTEPVIKFAGEVIFAIGDKGDSMYVVKSGEVELQVNGRTVETVSEEGFFGEMALIESDPRSATAIAKTDCVLIPINEKRFEFMTQEIPFFAINVMKGLSKRLRETVKSLS